MIWINPKREQKKDGCLMILNMTNAEVNSLSPEYFEVLKDTHSLAVADGWLIIWAFDNNTTPDLPEYFDKIEDQTYVRMMFDVCERKDSNFKLDPAERRTEFLHMSAALRNGPFKWSGALKLMGACSIDSSKVLMPPIEVL